LPHTDRASLESEFEINVRNQEFETPEGVMKGRTNTMLRIKSLLLLSALMFGARLPLTAATGVTYGVGACGLTGITSFPTITAALEATPAPSLIEVCPGTYPDQIVITKPVTIEGILIDGAGLASITVPSGGLKTNATNEFGNPVAAQIWVDNATGPVNISNIAVGGSGNGVSGDTFIVGVFYENSSGTVNHLQTRFQQGNGNGIGVWIEGGSAKPAVTIENSNAHDFELAGIWADSGSGTGGLAAVIENNSIIGTSTSNLAGLLAFGQVALTASGNFINSPVGISIGFVGGSIGTTGVPTGSVSNNTVTGDGSVGIVVYAGETSLISNKIYEISGPGIAIFNPVTVQDNTIIQTTYGISFSCIVDNNVSGNTLSFIHSDGLLNVPTSVTSTNAYFNVPTIRSGGC
jgi:hypothetical protein